MGSIALPILASLPSTPTIVRCLVTGERRRVILEAPLHDKDCVLGNILAAHFPCFSDPSRAPSHIQAAKSRIEQATSYEKAVFNAVNYLIFENRDDDVAVDLHSKLLKEFPKDLVSLNRAQLLCFYMAQPDLSLGLAQQFPVYQVLPKNQQEDYIYGMLAFPLLELGRMADAEEAGKKGIEINKKDCWAQHALCHVHQHECRFKEALQFMEECSSSWSSCSSFMYTHNWWHVALCYLEGHSPITKVLEVYDNFIWKELERVDTVCGEVNWYLELHLDVLILWALAKTGELSKAQDLLDGLKYRTSKMSKKKQQLIQKGIQLAEALHEYGRGSDKQALELLGADFDANDCKIIGASDEQVDVFNEVWCSMLLNTGQATKAIEVITRKIKKREGVPFLWHLLERGYAMTRRPEAANTGEKARALEAAYFQ